MLGPVAVVSIYPDSPAAIIFHPRNRLLRTSQPVPMKKQASFAWFEYEGRDPLFDEHVPRDGEYQNPVIAGFYPDPTIVRVGEDYYLATSTFAFFPGVPIFHSRDLVNWRQIGHILDRPSQLDLDGLEISDGIFAPALRYHDGTFYMLTTLVGNGGNFIVKATDPSGPWSDPVWLPEVVGIDPSIFFDDDGKAYVVNNGDPAYEPLYEGHKAIWIQEFDLAEMKTIGERRVIVDGGVDISQEPIWIEGPHIHKVDGVYYLIAAEGGTAEDHSEVVFRSDEVWGPYIPYEHNPILTQRHLDAERNYPVTSTGHADIVQTPEGVWWMVFLGTRPYEGDLYNTGRETFMMPVAWRDGWPTVVGGTDPLPFVHRKPNLPATDAAETPLTGNFVLRDRFDAPELAPYWMFIRTPRRRWYSMGDHGLRIEARPVDIGGRGQPSFIGRRQQHMYATATVELQFNPRDEGDRAGLVAFQNDDYYLFIGVAKRDGGMFAEAVKRAGEEAGVIARQEINIDEEQPIQLRIEADGAEYRLSYSLDGASWQTLADRVDGRILSTRIATGFVGTMLGMYAASGT